MVRELNEGATMTVTPPKITEKTRLGLSGTSYRNLLNEVEAALDAYDEMESGEGFPSLARRSRPACTTREKIAAFDASAERPKRSDYEEDGDSEEDVEDKLEIAVLDYRKAVSDARAACIDCPIRSHCLAYSLTNMSGPDKLAPDKNMVYGAWTSTTRKSIIFRLFQSMFVKRHPGYEE